MKELELDGSPSGRFSHLEVWDFVTRMFGMLQILQDVDMAEKSLSTKRIARFRVFFVGRLMLSICGFYGAEWQYHLDDVPF